MRWFSAICGWNSRHCVAYLCNLHSRNDAFIIPHVATLPSAQTSFPLRACASRENAFTCRIFKLQKAREKDETKINSSKCKLHFPLVGNFTVSFAFKTFSAGLQPANGKWNKEDYIWLKSFTLCFPKHQRQWHIFSLLLRLLLASFFLSFLPLADVSNYPGNDRRRFTFWKFFFLSWQTISARAAKDKHGAIYVHHNKDLRHAVKLEDKHVALLSPGRSLTMSFRLACFEQKAKNKIGKLSTAK